MPSHKIKIFLNSFFILIYFSLPATILSAQSQGTKLDSSLVSLVLQNQEGSAKIANNGVYYEGENIKVKLVVNEKNWNKKDRFYCYVLIYSETDGYYGFTLGYPDQGDNNAGNSFPKFDNSGSLIKEVVLFDGIVSAPFGKDNYVLIMTENPISNYSDLFHDTEDDLVKREELLKLIKGSKLSSFYKPEYGELFVKTTQVEARPIDEKKGIAKSRDLKTIFVINDSSEIFFTPTPQSDIVRDNFPTVDIIDPQLDTITYRGVKILQSNQGKKVLIRGIAIDRQRGIKKIMINNYAPSTYRELSGYFDYLYELKNGINTVDVTIENNEGFKRMIRLKFQYNAKEEMISREGKDYLLVIGINNYKDLPKLQNAKKDAMDFENLMLNNFDYKKENTIELFDETATKKNIYNQLTKFVDSLAQNDKLLIYFSGHGYYDSKLDLGYWIPVNASNGESDEYLNNLDITRRVQKMKAKNIFIIADACYSGALLRDLQNENSKEYKSRMVLCSGKLKPVSDGIAGTNSPFAKVVLDFFTKSKGSPALASDLIQFVKKSFPATANQKPVGGAVDEVGDENGDFIFKIKN